MPDTEITRAETRERARLLLVRSYDVGFDSTPGPHTFGSASLIRFDCHSPGSSTHADLIAASAYTSSATGMHRADSADGGVHIYAKLAQACARTAYACFIAAGGTDPGLARIVRDHRDTAARALRARTRVKAGDR
jgi:hypothetical protein